MSVLVCGSELGAFAHEFRKVAVDDAVTLLDGIVAREDVLGVVVAKWQVKGGEIRKVIKNTPLTSEFAPRRPPETLKLRVSAQNFKAFSHIDRKAVVLGFDDVVEKVVSLKNARLMGDAVVAPTQEGARGFYRRAAHAPKKLCFGGQIRRSRTEGCASIRVVGPYLVEGWVMRRSRRSRDG